MDLSGLIKGLMVVIGIALATGHLNDLKRWTIHEIVAPSHIERGTIFHR